MVNAFTVALKIGRRSHLRTEEAVRYQLLACFIAGEMDAQYGLRRHAAAVQ